MNLSSLKSQLYKSIKEKDTLRVSVLRYLISAVHNKEIDLRGSGEELTDERVMQVLEKQIKQRKDSIQNYKEGGREDLVEKEQSELEVLQSLKDLA